MHIILRGVGVPEEAILIENRSVNTYMNGVETVKILQERKVRKVLLISHDYHLFRLMEVFQKLGIETYPYAANLAYSSPERPWWLLLDWENLARLQTIAHEYIGLIAYKLTGKI